MRWDGAPVAWILFAWVFVSQAGVPVPVVPSLLAAGMLVGKGRISLERGLSAIVGASLSADLTWHGSCPGSIPSRRGTGAARIGISWHELVVTAGALGSAVIWAGLATLHGGVTLMAVGGRVTGRWP
jgi:hypothetical protein